MKTFLKKLCTSRNKEKNKTLILELVPVEWVSIFINRYQLIFGYIPVDFIPALMNAEHLPKQIDKQVNRDLYGPPSEQKRKAGLIKFSTYEEFRVRFTGVY